MMKVRAKYANGVLTPLEPLELEEGLEVELNIGVVPNDAHDQDSTKRKFRVIPNHSGLLPGMDDLKRMKQLLEDEDIEHYLRVQEFGRGT